MPTVAARVSVFTAGSSVPRIALDTATSHDVPEMTRTAVATVKKSVPPPKSMIASAPKRRHVSPNIGFASNAAMSLWVFISSAMVSPPR